MIFLYASICLVRSSKRSSGLPQFDSAWVGMCLTVEGTPPISERLYGLGSTSAPAWRLPAWRWHTVAKHLTHRPDVLRQPCCHGWRLPSAVLQSETAMHRTEVIHGSHQI